MSETLNLNGELVDFTPSQISDLLQLPNHPGWETLLTIVRGFETGTRAAVESPATPLEQIRELQGRLSVVTTLLGLFADLEARREED